MDVDNENSMDVELKYQTIPIIENNTKSNLNDKYFCGSDNLKNDNSNFLNEEHIDLDNNCNNELTDMPIEEKVILGQNDDQYIAMSKIDDYQFRPQSYTSVSLYDWIILSVKRKSKFQCQLQSIKDTLPLDAFLT